jgi:hypothetical protein
MCRLAGVNLKRGSQTEYSNFLSDSFDPCETMLSIANDWLTKGRVSEARSVRCERGHMVQEADNERPKGRSGAMLVHAIERVRIDVRERISGPHFPLILDLYDALHRRATFLQNITDSVKPTSRCPSTLPLRHLPGAQRHTHESLEKRHVCIPCGND